MRVHVVVHVAADRAHGPATALPWNISPSWPAVVKITVKDG